MKGVPLLTGVQAEALRALALFRFLTADLLALWGVGDASHVRVQLTRMEGWRLVGGTAVSGKPGEGRLPRLYYLTPAGAQLVAVEMGEPMPVPVKTPPKLVEAMPHRLAIIETHIRLRQWAAPAGIGVAWCRAEYDAGQSREVKATGVRYDEATGQFDPASAKVYTPDALARLVPGDGKPRMVAIEVYRGGRANTLEHFLAKLPELRTVCQGGAVEDCDRHASESGTRFVVLFMDAEMRGAALRRWPEPEAEVWGQFFVKAMPDLVEDFGGGWWQPGSRERRELM